MNEAEAKQSRAMQEEVCAERVGHVGWVRGSEWERRVWSSEGGREGGRVRESRRVSSPCTRD